MRPRTSRRQVIQGMSGLAGAAAFGCASDPEVAQQEEELIGCLFSKKAKQAMKPRGIFGGIEHVVVLMMENRSFDHYFGALSIDPGRIDDRGNHMGGEGRADVMGLTGDELNLNLAGEKVPVFRQTQTLLGDIAHDWDNCHRQFDFEGSGVGKNDGFVREHETDVKKGAASACATQKYFGKNVGCPEIAAPMGFYAREDLPVSYALADNYTLCDQWFSSVLGPTWPNRFYLHAGSSRGETSNHPVLGMRTIWEKMRQHCLPVINYYCDLPWAHVVGEGFVLSSELGDGIVGGVLQQFFSSQPGIGSFHNDVENDNLPAFSVIDPGFSSGYDDHPPSDVKLGQAFISYVYHVLASNPKVWEKTLFVITYDEHGSFYDHVVPPGNVPGSPQSFDEFAAFRQLGIRVPSLVIGPHVKKGHVSHVQYDHCSVLSTLYDRYDLASGGVGHLNERVRHTATLADCIDQSVGAHEGGAAPPGPAVIPQLEFSESELMDWVAKPFPDGQEGLARLADTGAIPRQHDLRQYRRQQMADFLKIGEKVGALRLTR